MEPKEAPGKENMGTRKKNLPFLRSRLYMLERRKTDSLVESSVPGDHSGTLRRTQSDRGEYNQKLQGNLHETSGPGLLRSCSCIYKENTQGRGEKQILPSSQEGK